MGLHSQAQQTANPVKFVGGRLCLDFINTVGGRITRPGHRGPKDYADLVLAEKISSYRDLIVWSRLAGALASREMPPLVRQAARHPDAAAKALERAAALREALYRLFKASIEGWRPEGADMSTFARELRSARSCEELVYGAAGFTWEWDRGIQSLDRLLWPVCRSAAELLSSPEDLARVRQCAGDRCGWMFLDTSRNRSRHWCDMKDCGNRNKVRRFRERAAK